jgi:hypothetical protein
MRAEEWTVIRIRFSWPTVGLHHLKLQVWRRLWNLTGELAAPLTLGRPQGTPQYAPGSQLCA